MLRLEELRLENFRCFDDFTVSFERDLTVLFAENGGGKSALLTAIAMGLDFLQPRPTKELVLDAPNDTRRITGIGAIPERAAHCALSWTATIGERPHVQWSIIASARSRKGKGRIDAASEAIDLVRMPGKRWPLLGYYSTSRMVAERKRNQKAHEVLDRWEGYTDCLAPLQSDTVLVDWLRTEALGDYNRKRRGEPKRGFERSVLDTIQRATPTVASLRYDSQDGLMVTFDSGREAKWIELSDGFHVFMGLIGDIARRAVILNSQDGADAPLQVEGVVLIDEIDLHLHPRWQRRVLHGLRAAFPKLQLIVTTHSPQVLSSAENRQVRRLVDWKLQEAGVFVEGRDSNAILRDLMGTDDRDEAGRKALRALHAAIDEERFTEARTLLDQLRERWGGGDPELVYAEGFLDEEP